MDGEISLLNVAGDLSLPNVAGGGISHLIGEGTSHPIVDGEISHPMSAEAVREIEIGVVTKETPMAREYLMTG